MKTMARLFFAACVALALAPVPAGAQDAWQFRLTPYLWFAGIKGDVATIPGLPSASIDMSSSDVLKDLDASFMGAFEAKKGRHGGFVDFLYSDVQSDTVLAPSIGLTLKSTSKTTVVSAAYEYELFNRDGAVVDAFGGLRYWKVDTRLQFDGGLGLLAGRSIQHKESWVDPMIGIKGTSPLGASKFFVTGILGIGGFGVGSDRFYDVSAHLGYQWSKTIGTTLGYRRYDVKFEDGSFLYDVRQDGWLLGATFSF